MMTVLLVVMLGGLFFVSSRAKKKQIAAQRAKLDAVVPGSRITTVSGLQGTVTAVADDTMELEIAPGVRTTWLRAAVRDVLDTPLAVPADTLDDDAPAAHTEDAESALGRGDGFDSIDADTASRPAAKDDIQKRDLS